MSPYARAHREKYRFIPESVQDTYEAREAGLQPSVQRVLNLIDTSELSWPSIAAVLREFTEAGIDLDENSVPMAVKLGRRRWAQIPGAGDENFEQTTLTAGSGSIVYYIRRGNLIKIGTTTDPHDRFTDLFPDEILAVEPGGRSLEVLRHRQFKHLCVNREHFRDEPELRDHITRIRQANGEPDPSWPSAANIGNLKKKEWRLTEPTSTETLTAVQAESVLGIKQNTLRGWRFRNRIQVAGHDEKGRFLFYREHLISLRDSSHRRHVQRF